MTCVAHCDNERAANIRGAWCALPQLGGTGGVGSVCLVNIQCSRMADERVVRDGVFASPYGIWLDDVSTCEFALERRKLTAVGSTFQIHRQCGQLPPRERDNRRKPG